ncbi:hypothetical protein SAXI111661_14595 [Saccharomonospora xinjiangensis]|uniref:hypothetical protein n=1 Tax=Saccharomonospora xinjiangensis TaxID=75294 RepID=UPI0010C52F33|nr:hypothetical protein [Saccharomonospora xinjiangensis]QBQ60481.1 hypothetical protein EYD13_10640 [Saccharomonospora xinjiangensis]
MADTYSPIPELNQLKEFYDTQDDPFAVGFEMPGYGKDCHTDPQPELAERLVYFAHANSSGSLYGIWRKDDRDNLATLPVVAAGDEGGLHLVARDFLAFLQLLASLPSDAEPYLGWDFFDVNDGHDPVDNTPYLTWLARTFDLAPVAEWDRLVNAAQEELGREWAAWIHPIVPDAVWSPVHELNQLATLDDSCAGDLATGFCLNCDYGDAGQATNPDLTADLVPFATNHDTATVFALWCRDGGPASADAPVVALGTEEGARVIARDLREFLHVIAGLTRTGIRCDHTGVVLRDGEPVRNHKAFVAWLERAHGLRPATDPAAVIATAHTELGALFAAGRLRH